MVGGLGKVGAEHRLVLQERPHELADWHAGVLLEVFQEVGHGGRESGQLSREGNRLLGSL